MDFNKYEVKGKTICECGHQFIVNEIGKLEKIGQNGFYGNILKHFSKIECPNCKKETILLLKQKGQTYELIDLAVLKESKKEESNNIICPICERSFKNQSGLKLHMKSHEN